MKGLLFTELLEMVHEDFGYNTANSIVLHSNLAPASFYAETSAYHRNEMSLLFDRLQQRTKLPAEELAVAFGRHLCRRMTHVYPQHKAYVNRLFSVISKRNATPVFEYLRSDGNNLTVLYNPYAKPACLSDGMIKGYLDCLQELSQVEETVFSNGHRKFVITLN